MDPIEFDGQDVILAPPAKWNETQSVKCGGLPVKRSEIDGVPAQLSYWKPDATDLKILNEGGVIELALLGMIHPPVMVSTAKVSADVDRQPEPGKLG